MPCLNYSFKQYCDPQSACWVQPLGDFLHSHFPEIFVPACGRAFLLMTSYYENREVTYRALGTEIRIYRIITDI